MVIESVGKVGQYIVTQQLSQLLLWFGLMVPMLSGCSSPKDGGTTRDVPAESPAGALGSSSAAVENGKDTTHRFIRTADMKFKVKDVASATYAVEKITSQFGGFVTYTNLKSTIDNVETSIVSADSSLERTYYTVVNEVTIRVPNTRLDTTLKSIATLIDYLDYRVIRADDAALTLLANKLTQSRAAYTEQRIVNAIDARGNKLAETTTAEELLSGKQEQADNATLANRSLQDQIRFSTITLALYQRQTIRRELVASYPPIDAYKPGFATRMGDSMKYGWGILEDVLVFIVRLWGLLLLAIVAYYGYRRYGYKIKSKPIT